MKMKKIIPLLVATSMIFTSCGSSETAETEEVLTAVKTTTVEPSSIQKSTTYTGKIEPVEQVSVVAKLSGTVTNTYKNVGDTVTAGDTLYSVDDSDISIAVQQAQAQANAADLAVQSAQNAKSTITGAQYDQQMLSLETSISSLETQLETAKEARDVAKDAYDFAKTSYDNAKVLYDSGAMSKVEYDQAELSYTQAQMSYNQAEASVSTLESQLDQANQSYELTKNQLVSESQNSADIGIQQAQASAATADLAVQSAAKNLDDVSPTSPISGVVSSKGVTTGQMVGSGSLAYTISNIDEVVATIKVSENIINKLNVGDSLEIYISALDKNVTGTITEVNPVADSTSTYPVKVKIQNPDHEIKPGMFCDVTIVTESADNVITLPREAVLRNMEQYYVYTEVDGTVVSNEVTTGIDNGESIEILTGLQNGDSVITEGQSYVSEGEQINVVE